MGRAVPTPRLICPLPTTMASADVISPVPVPTDFLASTDFLGPVASDFFEDFSVPERPSTPEPRDPASRGKRPWSEVFPDHPDADADADDADPPSPGSDASDSLQDKVARLEAELAEARRAKRARIRSRNSPGSGQVHTLMRMLQANHDAHAVAVDRPSKYAPSNSARHLLMRFDCAAMTLLDRLAAQNDLDWEAAARPSAKPMDFCVRANPERPSAADFVVEIAEMLGVSKEDLIRALEEFNL